MNADMDTPIAIRQGPRRPYSIQTCFRAEHPVGSLLHMFGSIHTSMDKIMESLCIESKALFDRTSSDLLSRA